MPSKNKVRGNGAEYHVRKVVNSSGGTCERAYGSDGRSMGLTEKDDGLINGRRWQSKRFEKVPVWFQKNCTEYIEAGIELVTFYVDRAKGRPRQVYVIQTLESYLNENEDRIRGRPEKGG